MLIKSTPDCCLFPLSSFWPFIKCLTTPPTALTSLNNSLQHFYHSIPSIYSWTKFSVHFDESCHWDVSPYVPIILIVKYSTVFGPHLAESPFSIWNIEWHSILLQHFHPLIPMTLHSAGGFPPSLWSSFWLSCLSNSSSMFYFFDIYFSSIYFVHV